MRSILDAKTPAALCVREAPFSYALDAPKESSVDQFVLPQGKTPRLLSKSPSPRFQAQETGKWWKELQHLIDALPSSPVASSISELDDKSKEALRTLARSAPHRMVND